MLVFIFILTFIILIAITLVLSVVKTRIKNLEISNENSKKIIKNYEIHFEVYFLNKIKILDIKIDEDLMNKINIKDKLNKIDFSKMKKDMPLKEESKKIVKKLDINLSNINLNIEIGLDDVILTSASVAIISALLGIGLSKVIKKYNSNNHKYLVKPLYIDKNIIKISLNCIIEVKVVHIIYIIYILLQKRRVYKHERTSNRRSYDYSYE